VVALLALGNLYQARQLAHYLPEVGLPGWDIQSSLDRGLAALSGAGRILSGQAELPGGKGRWYFDASRPVLHDGPDTPIAEFPLFSFLYGDLHPHLLAIPVLLAILAWIASFLAQDPAQPPPEKRWPEQIASWFSVALAIGMLRPAHTWDYPTMLGLVGAAVIWDGLRKRSEPSSGLSRHDLAWIAGRFLVLGAITVILYRPFSAWFATAYSSVELWKGARTPLVDYLTVHGLFLFILTSYLVWLSWPWLAQRIAGGSLRRAASLGWILADCLAALGLGYIFWITDCQAFIVGLPLLAWTAALLFAPQRSSVRVKSLEHRLVLALFAAGVGVTLLVEVVVLRGDVGRANMVMRYYNQAWIFFSLASGIALAGCLFPALFGRSSLDGRAASGWRVAWAAALTLLVLAATAYPLTAVRMKITDRWPNIQNPPHRLDGMAYMLGEYPPGKYPAGYSPAGEAPAIYDDEGRLLNLAVDYAGIRWMQENIPGTPTIVEGNTTEYRWGSRISIYTGLPSVAGWSWHVRQHNSLLEGSVIERRIEQVHQFYNTPDPVEAAGFLRRYGVEYVVVGGLERAYYAPEGIAKFNLLVDQGVLREVFFHSQGDSQIRIYQVALDTAPDGAAVDGSTEARE
jgi:YYY domain-containing protein